MKMIVMNVPRPLGALICASPLLLAAACSGVGSGTAASDAQPGQLKIVTAFYPFQFISERVAGSHAQVESLTQPGAEPHDLELTPRQVADLSTADFVVYEKTFQAAADEAVAHSGNDHVLDTTSVVPLQPLASGDDHEAESTETPAQGTEEGPDHEESAMDPHVWLDPTNVATIAAAVATQLSTIDPEHAADYAANAKALQADLTTLDESFTTGLASCERTKFITSHTAFGYLAKRYGLDQIGISGLSPEAEPSPSRIAEVQGEAKEHGVTTIFYETLVSPAVAQSMADDLGLKTDVLDPIEGITDASKGQDYLAIMKANLAALKTANSCS